MLVEGLARVLWDDLLDANGPWLEGSQTQRRLDVVVLLQDVEGLHEDLVEVVLGVVFAFVFDFGAASALGLGVELGLWTGCWSFFLLVVVLHREVFLDGLSGLPLASRSHSDACFLELLFVLVLVVGAWCGRSFAACPGRWCGTSRLA